MASKLFEDVMLEYFDMQDDITRKTLLAIDEADQNKTLDSLTSQLYQQIMDKVSDIDFHGVIETKGDITKLQNYEQMLECIDIIKGILAQYNQDTKIPDEILTAISNVRERKDMFEKGFSLDMDLPITLYNSIVTAIVYSVSLIIQSSIEYIKDAGSDTYQIKFDKVKYHKSINSLMFDNIKAFNRACASGELDRSMDYVIKASSRQLLGIDDMTAVSIIGIAGIALTIIPIIRELTFFFFHAKQSISDYFDIQADLIQMNSQYLQSSNMYTGRTNKKDVVKRQEKVAKSFRKAANAMAVDNRQAEAKAKKDTAASKKKYKMKDIKTDSKLDSAPDFEEPISNNGSSLF